MRSATTTTIRPGAVQAFAAFVLCAAAPSATVQADEDPGYGRPETATLTGIVRDFRERTAQHGHPDFERKPNAGFGHYMGNVADMLGPDGKPVFTGAGNKVSSQWKDAQGRPIHPSLYDPSLGDSEGSLGTSDQGGIVSAATFQSWFRDVPGVNVSTPLSITLEYDSSKETYVFDDKDDPVFSNIGGFFPINGQLFGNSEGDNRNYHFTFELQTQFVYKRGDGLNFRFIGDDDVWVYIDDRLVIDLGGVHAAVDQTVDLDRLDWLVDGETYTLHFFFAERHRTQSNFRIETTLILRSGAIPASMGMWD